MYTVKVWPIKFSSGIINTELHVLLSTDFHGNAYF